MHCHKFLIVYFVAAHAIEPLGLNEKAVVGKCDDQDSCGQERGWDVGKFANRQDCPNALAYVMTANSRSRLLRASASSITLMLRCIENLHTDLAFVELCVHCVHHYPIEPDYY